VFQLRAWFKKDGSSIVTGSNGAYILPNGATKSPDAAWILEQLLIRFTDQERRRFLPLAPDFIVELRSESDNLTGQIAKMEEWVENGVRLAWLIDPYHIKNKFIYIAKTSNRKF